MKPEFVSAPDRALVAAESFATEVQQAATRLFGREEPCGALNEIVGRLVDDCRRLRERGAAPLPAIALVGRVGEGKSWLARCFLAGDAGADRLREEIRTGQNDSDRTQEVVWFGPEKPFGLAREGERYLAVARPLMLDLGVSYVVGDTPGFSDKDARCWTLAGLAATSAAIKIVVTSISQLRDGGVEHFIGGMNGALILPVVRFEPESPGDTGPGETSRHDVLAEMGKWRRHAPASRILDPCFMPQRGIVGEAAAVEAMRECLRAALEPHLTQPANLQQSVGAQIVGRIVQARQDVARALRGFRQSVSEPLRKLDELTAQMPAQVERELLGEEPTLRAAIRQHLRADWIEHTPLPCFPYRTFANLFALTHGAWDRLFFSAAGSVPSLALAMFKTARNVREARQFATFCRSGLEERVNRSLAEKFRAAARNFEAAVDKTLPPDAAPAPARELQVHCRGLSEIEAAARGFMQQTVADHRASRFTVWLFALLGAGSFAYLVAGPVIALYRAYLAAHGHALDGTANQWTEFPQPSAAMVLASLLLSVAPAVFTALIAMAWCCSARRVGRIAREFRAETGERIRDGTLVIQLDDPKIEAARLLLTIEGRAGG